MKLKILSAIFTLFIMINAYSACEPDFKMPEIPVISGENDNTKNKVYEAGLLKLNCDKALMHHRWLPTLNFEQTVRMTTEWYKKFYASESMQDFSLNQIDEYCNFAIDKKIDWAKN